MATITKIRLNGIDYQIQNENYAVDSELNLTSKNPVENKVITQKLNTQDNSIKEVESAVSGIRQGSVAVANASKLENKTLSQIKQEINSEIEIPTITVDSALNSTSNNPVQNKIITNKLNEQAESIANASSSISTLQNNITSGSITAGNSSKLEGKTLTEIKNELSVDGDEYASKAIYGNDAVSLGRKKDKEIGIGSFAFGSNVEASGAYSYAEGGDTIASKSYAHAEGWYSSAYGERSHAEGFFTKASGEGSHAEGSQTIASGIYSHAEGGNTTASGEESHAEGYYSVASGLYSHAEGGSTEASGLYSHAEGYDTTASTSSSHAEGAYTTASNYASHTSGKYNKAMTNGGYTSTQIGDVFVVGNGTSNTSLSNAFRITYTGEIYGTKNYQASGADYAEFIKPWADGNPDEEDRVGYFVTIKNKLLYKANEGDYIVGITSGNPSVVGNADEDYYWRYERDEFNRIVMEDVPLLVQKVDEDGNPMYDEETYEPIMIDTGEMQKNARMKLAEGYDSSKQDTYVERKYRPEWDYVGMIGVIPVRDDGTCIPGGLCKCGKDGIATYTGVRDFDTFFVIERISNNVISVELR